MKVEFGKDICNNFNLAANKEWMETNNLGGYAATTIYGMNNRRFHGLYVIPAESHEEKIILLSKFEESIFIEKQVYELSTNQFTGGVYPDGYKYLKKFSINPFPKFLYEIEGKRIEKTIFMLHDQHVLIIRFAYKNQGPRLELVIKPMIAARKISELSHEATNINTDSYLKSGEMNVVRLAPKEGIPELKIYFNTGEYIPAPLWYHNYVYEKDFRRKQSHSKSAIEDLFNPGFFTISLEPYDTLDMFISVDQLNQFDYEAAYFKEKEYRYTFNTVINQLPQVAEDVSKRIEILAQTKDESYPPYVSNFPTDEQNTREMLYSLWGLTLIYKDRKLFQDALLIYINQLKHGLLPEIISVVQNTGQYQSVDLSLILINLIYYLYEVRIDLKFIEEHLFEPCKEIIEVYCKGTNTLVRQEKDGLISAGSDSVVTSWIPHKSGDKNVIRYGKMCEINALWYNSLKIMEFFSRALEKKRLVKKYAQMAEQMKNSFFKKFWSTKHLCFYDVIQDDIGDTTFSISQLYLVGLPFSMLDVERGIYVIKQIEENLLTPLGLRSLSPNDKHYKGRLKNPKEKKDSSYYRGSIWPWTIGMYVDAVINFRGSNQQVISNLNAYLESLGQFFYEQGTGNISEYFEGNPPYRRYGKICFGLNLTEFLRSYYTIFKICKDKSYDM